MDKLSSIFRIIFTAVVLVAAIFWLYVIFVRLDVAPTKDGSGNITVNPYQNAKDILSVFLPLVTVAFGYWFGVQGKEKAEDKADKAKQQLQAVVATSPDPKLLNDAMTAYPNAFQ
jgi:hypothetical protein